MPALLLSEVNDEVVAQLSIEQLLSNPLVDPRRHLDLERVQQYAQMLDELPPIAVFRLEDQTLLLVDGYHRVAAAQKAGRTTIDADIREGTRADAVTLAAAVAVRERGFSEEQAREAIRRYSGSRWPTQIVDARSTLQSIQCAHLGLPSGTSAYIGRIHMMAS
jgi:hypothetical protein